MGRNLIIKVSDLHVLYPGGIKALDGINLEIAEGERVVLIGPNGSGKTTLLRVIMGLEPGYKGHVEVMGWEPLRLPKPLRRSIAYMPESLSVPSRLKVAEYLEIIAELRGCREWLDVGEILGLVKYRKATIGSLSQGYKRRVMLAAAVLCKPRLVVLDEPYSNVDVETYAVIDDLLQSFLPRDSTLLVSTHILPRIRGSSIIVIANGKIIEKHKRLDETIIYKLKCGSLFEETLSKDRMLELVLKRGCQLVETRCLTAYDIIKKSFSYKS